uniref:Uncharacterized protein n=1 Tax=Setaria viridis TaxID=4556 RepID=A0A4U6VU73_SETVI|nr:hypothetical protein SEVIR_2G174301v2 [Setaria viridis]
MEKGGKRGGLKGKFFSFFEPYSQRADCAWAAAGVWRRDLRSRLRLPLPPLPPPILWELPIRGRRYRTPPPPHPPRLRHPRISAVADRRGLGAPAAGAGSPPSLALHRRRRRNPPLLGLLTLLRRCRRHRPPSSSPRLGLPAPPPPTTLLLLSSVALRSRRRPPALLFLSSRQLPATLFPPFPRRPCGSEAGSGGGAQGQWGGTHPGGKTPSMASVS